MVKLLYVVEVIHSPYAVSSEDGDVLFELLCNSIKNNQKTRVSFSKVKSITSAFLNSAIGKLYNHFSDEEIDKVVEFVIKESWMELIVLVRNNAKEKLQNPEEYKKSLDKAMEDL